jgi:hypothetical protein
MKRFLILFLLFFLQENLSAKLPDLIPYRKGNLWGYCDSTKKIIIQPIYERVFPFDGKTAVAVKDKKYGIIDQYGKVTTPFIYESIDQEGCNGKRVVSTKKKHYGLINETGKIMIPCSYTKLYWESDKYLRAHEGGVYGELDTTGKIIIPFEYVVTDTSQGYTFGGNAKYGLFVFSKGSGYRFGVVDSTGKTIIPFEYNLLSDFGDGYFFAHKNYKNSDIDSTLVFDRFGTRVDESSLFTAADSVYSVSNLNYMPYLVKEGKNTYYYKGWCTTGLKMVYEKHLIYAGSFHNGLASFVGDDSLCGFVNEKFEIVIPPKYGWSWGFDPIILH